MPCHILLLFVWHMLFPLAPSASGRNHSSSHEHPLNACMHAMSPPLPLFHYPVFQISLNHEQRPHPQTSAPARNSRPAPSPPRTRIPPQILTPNPHDPILPDIRTLPHSPAGTSASVGVTNFKLFTRQTFPLCIIHDRCSYNTIHESHGVPLVQYKSSNRARVSRERWYK